MRKAPLLPKPSYKVDNELFWDPIPRTSHIPPFGYEIDPDDRGILVPDNEKLRYLEVAKKLLKKYSYREVADWLTVESGTSISHAALRQRVLVEDESRKEATIAWQIAKKYEELLRKAYKAEEKARRFRPAERRRVTELRSGDGFDQVQFDPYEVQAESGDRPGLCCPTCNRPYNLPTQRGSSD